MQVVEFYGNIGSIYRNREGLESLSEARKNPHAVAWYLNPMTPIAPLIMNLPEPPASPKAKCLYACHELAHDINTSPCWPTKLFHIFFRNLLCSPGLAMLMEKQTQTEEWFVRWEPISRRLQGSFRCSAIDYADQIIFLRWSSTIYEFERILAVIRISESLVGVQAETSVVEATGWMVNPDALAKYHINVSLYTPTMP